MPSRNIIRFDIDDTYYHVYSRGVNKQAILIDNEDKAYFINLLSRYLSKIPCYDKNGAPYVKLHTEVQLLAYCIMDNHFHLLVYQKNQSATSDFVKRVVQSYVYYFNEKHARVGPLFQSRYKARQIKDGDDLMNISRYIHQNPNNYMAYSYSSLQFYLSPQNAPDWVQTKSIRNILGKENYKDFI